MSTSYAPALVGGGGLTEEIDRLERQADLTFAAEVDLLQSMVGEGSTHLRVLDIGCGTGAFTRRLRAAWPACDVEGVDVDPDLLAHTGPPSRLVGRTGPLGAAATYDLAVVRYVAQHLDADTRRAMWSRIRDVLRPGGVLAVIDVDDADWGSITPSVPAVERVYRKIARLQEARGGDRDLLPRVCDELADPANGFDAAERRRGQVTSDRVPLERFGIHLGPERHIGHLTDGGMDLDDFALVTAAWNAVRRHPESRATVHVHVVFARRAERPVR